MKKVAIVSCYFKNNYGSLLQAYATQKILDDNNIPNETINISELRDFSKGKKKYYLSQITNLNFIKTKFGMIKLKGYQKINRNLKNNIMIRNKEFTEFKKKFKLSKTFNTYAELNEYTKNNYSDVIVGSDQLWLPVNIVSDYYTLNWVPNEINKISYATSFGISKIPEEYKELYSYFLKRIDNISVREANALNLVKDISGREAKLVCDPTLLLTKEQWMDIQNSKRIIKDKYIFCYFLGSNLEHRKFVERLKEKTGYKIVSINHCDEYVKYSDEFADYIPYDVGPGEFLNYIRNAEYVCTDSFHGTVFSLINNTKFFTFRRFSNKTKMSTNSRVVSLLNIVDLQERLICGTENIDDEVSKIINFENVNTKLKEFREGSLNWLLKAITYNSQNECKHIEISDKVNCCGCTSCMNICPKNAITMISDEEGFLYPKIDEEKCINCGLCKKACPILNVKEEKINNKQEGFIVANKNEKILKNSTSGGAFSEIAKYILKNNGVVYGVEINENQVVHHIEIDSINDIEKFRNSKYVQSDLGDIFKKVKKNLNDDRWVCFSGTPCQIEGLISFLQKKYDKLVLVDVVCRAVPSPGVWKSYCHYLESVNGKISSVRFRDKSLGYNFSTMAIYYENGKVMRNGIESDPWLRMFFSGMIIRPSCTNCRFRKQYRNSDFTIWDCFNVSDISKKFNEKKGATRVLIHTEKGKKIFNNIKSEFEYEIVSPKKLVSDSTELSKSHKENNLKKEFIKDYQIQSMQDLLKKYFPNSTKVKLKKNIRIVLNKTGLDVFAKKIKRKITH